MAILSWRTDQGQSGEFNLQEGSIYIGREAGNECIVPDPSVSSRHCEALVQDGGLVIRDLGSTNGTFVQGQRVGNALIEPGDNFRLGNVEFSYTPAPSPVVAPPSAPRAAVRISKVAVATAAESSLPAEEADLAESPLEPSSPPAGVCFHHPASPAASTCAKCEHDLCPACVKLEQIGPKRVPFCRHCGGKCVPYGQPVVPQVKRRATFFEMLPGAFSYPFKGNGLILLATGTIFFGFLDMISSSVAARVFIIVGSILLVKIIMYGYLFAYMQKIVCASADGDPEPPGWPEVTDLSSDIFHPCWLFFATTAATFLPGILVASYAPAAGTALLVLGMLYFPMALLGVAMSDSLSGLNPLVVLSAILKVPGPYMVAALVFGLLVVVRRILPDYFTLPIVSYFVIALFALVLVTIEMRILGILYYTNREKFGWF